MRPWDWLTTLAFSGRTGEKTGRTKPQSSVTALSPLPHSWRRVTLVWETFSSPLVNQFQRSLDLDHNSDETLRSLAAAYQKLGNASAAEEAYRKAISLRPNYWGVYNAFGTFYYNQARYADAVAMFKKAIQLAPLSYNGYSNLGAMYLLLGLYGEAVEALKQSIALRPTANS
jgi:tetratricopeptide (TPR) repeat protein